MPRTRIPFFTFQRIIQYLSFITFILLLFLAMYPEKKLLPLDIYLRLDPLIALGTSIATWEIIDKAWIALSIIIVTLLLGRVFCGYICPFGTVIDLFDTHAVNTTTFKGKAGMEKKKTFRKYRRLKVDLLVITLLSAIFGITVFFILDPISLFTRTFTHVFYPLSIFLLNSLLDMIRPLASALGYVTLSHKYLIQPAFDSNFTIFFMFAAILYLSTRQQRFWCRYLCPLGALLGICSKPARIKRSVSEKCNSCGLCQQKCPMDAIEDDPFDTVQSECIQCETCVTVCPQNAVDFKMVSFISPGKKPSVNYSRRSLLTAMGTGFAISFLAKTNTADAHTNLVRPPGSIPEDDFLRRCVRCGECIKSCITNTLQPTGFEAGIEGLWTPRHNMRHAGCEQQCNMCGTVCPTQAIRSLPLDERKYARVGTAVINRDKCLAWEQHKLCIICDEQCPYNAIVFKQIDGVKRPFIDETKCNGCGICEEKCPIAGDSAIVVWPIGAMRLKKGSYVKASRQLKLSFNEEKDELEEIQLPQEENAPEKETPNLPQLPSGFIVE